MTNLNQDAVKQALINAGFDLVSVTYVGELRINAAHYLVVCRDSNPQYGNARIDVAVFADAAGNVTRIEAF